MIKPTPPKPVYMTEGLRVTYGLQLKPRSWLFWVALIPLFALATLVICLPFLPDKSPAQEYAFTLTYQRQIIIDQMACQSSAMLKCKDNTLQNCTEVIVSTWSCKANRSEKRYDLQDYKPHLPTT